MTDDEDIFDLVFTDEEFADKLRESTVVEGPDSTSNRTEGDK